MISDVLESWAQKLRVGTLRGPWEPLLAELRKCLLNSSNIHLAGPGLQVEASLPPWSVCSGRGMLEEWIMTNGGARSEAPDWSIGGRLPSGHL